MLLVKKLLLIIVLKILFISSSYSQIIYRNCNLEPNYDKGSEIVIDLESKTIKVITPAKSGLAVHKINQSFGTVIVSSNLVHTSQMSQRSTEAFTKVMNVEMSFDIENHTVSILVEKKPGITDEFSKHIDDEVAAGRLSYSIQDTCDVENTYDPMREKKLLNEINSSNTSSNNQNNSEINNDDLKNLLTEMNSSKNDLQLTEAEMGQLMKKIYSCWNLPLGLPDNVDKTFKINLQLKEDGNIISAEHTAEDKIKMQSSGQSNFKVLAQSGMRAIKLCAPYDLPKDKYEAWKNITINFEAV